MTKLTAGRARKFLKDWSVAFPELKSHHPRRIGRTVGPMYQGLLLERDSGGDRYLPMLHVHSLCRELDVLSLAFSQPLGHGDVPPVAPWWITVTQHDAVVDRARGALRRQSLHPFDQEISLSRHYVSRLEKFQSWESTGLYPIFSIEDLCMWAGWLGEPTTAEELLMDFRKCAEAWPANVFERMGGIDSWVTELLGVVRDKDLLRGRARENRSRLGLDDLPSGSLVA